MCSGRISASSITVLFAVRRDGMADALEIRAGCRKGALRPRRSPATSRRRGADSTLNLEYFTARPAGTLPRLFRLRHKVAHCVRQEPAVIRIEIAIGG
jgi:hypothetical protein